VQQKEAISPSTGHWR